jgi:hypothetical protein
MTRALGEQLSNIKISLQVYATHVRNGHFNNRLMTL